MYLYLNSYEMGNLNSNLNYLITLKKLQYFKNTKKYRNLINLELSIEEFINLPIFKSTKKKQLEIIFGRNFFKTTSIYIEKILSKFKEELSNINSLELLIEKYNKKNSNLSNLLVTNSRSSDSNFFTLMNIDLEEVIFDKISKLLALEEETIKKLKELTTGYYFNEDENEDYDCDVDFLPDIYVLYDALDALCKDLDLVYYNESIYDLIMLSNKKYKDNLTSEEKFNCMQFEEEILFYSSNIDFDSFDEESDLYDLPGNFGWNERMFFKFNLKLKEQYIDEINQLLPYSSEWLGNPYSDFNSMAYNSDNGFKLSILEGHVMSGFSYRFLNKLILALVANINMEV